MSSEKTVDSEQLPVNSEENPQPDSSDENSDSTPKLCSKVPPETPPKTQGVKTSRDSGIGILHAAAKQAARTNSRSDVHEYMRLRRSYV